MVLMESYQSRDWSTVALRAVEYDDQVAVMMSLVGHEDWIVRVGVSNTHE